MIGLAEFTQERNPLVLLCFRIFVLLHMLWLQLSYPAAVVVVANHSQRCYRYINNGFRVSDYSCLDNEQSLRFISTVVFKLLVPNSSHQWKSQKLKEWLVFLSVQTYSCDNTQFSLCKHLFVFANAKYNHLRPISPAVSLKICYFICSFLIIHSKYIMNDNHDDD